MHRRRSARTAALLALAALLTLTLFVTANATTSLTNVGGNVSSALNLSLTPVASGFAAPTFVTNAGDDSGRLFVLERRGVVRVIVNGQTRVDPFLDISSQVHTDDSEQGLLGLAFAPDYAQSGAFYVYFTALDWADTVMAFQVTDDPNIADPTSGRLVLSIPDREPNHNGGMLAFGPDGHLYIGVGDEGGHNDEYGNGQNLGTLFGKVLRIDPSPEGGYSTPADNLCPASVSCRPEIWAYGLRNPWRFSFDRVTGDLYIGDVGEANWEEVNIQPAYGSAGANYGWNRAEGAHCFSPNAGCDTSGITPPDVEYSHDLGCSITGGYVYRGTTQPSLAGDYLFADYCSGRIWVLLPGATPTVVQAATDDTQHFIVWRGRRR